MKFKTFTIATIVLLFCLASRAQTPKETALAKAKEAIKLEDDGKYDEALKLLAESHKLDPDDITYPYETVYVYYVQEKYQTVIDELSKLKDRPDSFDRLYELLGNSYDILKQPEKAIAIYEEGIKKFPKSGVMYLERGVLPLTEKKYDEALKYFEKGIEVAPNFASNYFWAAKLYCNSEEPMWGVMYGEIFINLERNSKRTQEISKLLFDTYKDKIRFNGGGKISVSFSKQNIVITNPDGKFKMPYSMIYEPTIGIAVSTETVIDLNSLDRIRQNFLKFYMQKFDKEYPNVLFTYQQKMASADQMEAYDHWLLLKGDEDAFTAWQSANKTKWDDFIKWYTANPMQLDETHRFSRSMY